MNSPETRAAALVLLLLLFGAALVLPLVLAR